MTDDTIVSDKQQMKQMIIKEKLAYSFLNLFFYLEEFLQFSNTKVNPSEVR